jgi:ATP/maltotriose-dependent transcriptional regulator MalT
MSSGDTAEARRLLDQALDAHRALGNRIGSAITLIRLSLTLSALGETGQAHKLTDEYLVLAEACESEWLSSFGHWARSVTWWLEGKVTEAEREARENVNVDWRHVGQLTTAFTIEVLAWTAVEQGRPDRAARLLGGLEPVWRRVGAPLPGYAFLLPYHEQCLAEARRQLGERAFHHAMDQGLESRFDEVVSYSLGLSGATVSSDPTSQGCAVLTPRERQVAACVADGMSNKDIAGALVIAERTAEGHVQHMLVKLGFTSRTQLASWFVATTASEAAKGSP